MSGFREWHNGMSYQVLARKWRPKNFAQLVGQEHVARALMNGLDSERLHHAFLFTGTRGVGKTTIARILSKSLNCHSGVTSEPCGQCPACVEIDEGRFVDLIEVDAASRTKVEDTRELLENVQYAPTGGRYKVYLIDEVHMLSRHSFNALLKTLEEPPPHVKFLLATTDPEKLPVTVLSRCLQFNLKKLPAADIVQRLSYILQQENIDFDESGLRLLARSAEGSMRDALSLLDQAIAFSGGQVADSEVRNMLGTIETGHIYGLIEQVHRNDAAAVMQTIEVLDERSLDYSDVLAEMISILHHIAMEQQVAGCMTEDWDDPDRIQAFARDISPQDVQLYYQIALQGRDDLRLNPVPREGFEITLLRMMAFRPWQEKSASQSMAASPASAGASAGKKMPSSSVEPTNSVPSDSSRAASGSSSGQPSDWSEIFNALDLRGMSRQMAANCQLEAIEGDIVRLILDQAHAKMLSEGTRQKTEEALSGFFGRPVKVRIQPGIVSSETPMQREQRQDKECQAAAIESIQQDENVRMMEEVFGATVAVDTVQPVDKSQESSG